MNESQGHPQIEARVLSPGVEVLLGDVRYIFPALDVSAEKEDTLILTVPLPGVREKLGRKGEPTGDKKGDMVLCMVTSERELFECTDEAFMQHGWIGKVPEPLIRQRWSSASLKRFLDGNAETIDGWELYRDIKAKFDEYVDFTGSALNASALCAIYAISTYFFFMSEYFPYLKIGGAKGVGKTKLGRIFSCLTFNGQIYARTSVPVIYRSAQDSRGCMIIDEAESLDRKSDEFAAYFQVLNSGFYRQGSAALVDKDSMKVTLLSTYSPKIIISISGLDDVLGDRAFEIILLRTLDRERAGREIKEGGKEWQELRDRLYLFLMQKWREALAVYESLKPSDFVGLEGRFWDLAKPLIAMARVIDGPSAKTEVEDELLGYLSYELKRKKAQTNESIIGRTLLALNELLGEKEKETIKLGVLREILVSAEGTGSEAWITSKYVARTLKNLELYVNPRKIKGVLHFDAVKSLMVDRAKRFGVDIVDKVDEVDQKQTGVISSIQAQLQTQPISRLCKIYPVQSTSTLSTMSTKSTQPNPPEPEAVEGDTAKKQSKELPTPKRTCGSCALWRTNDCPVEHPDLIMPTCLEAETCPKFAPKREEVRP